MPLANDVSFISALWGGFYSFFGVAQLCIMQISPFYIAFALALYFSNSKTMFLRRILATIPLNIGYILSFSIIFGSLGIRGIDFARYINYNMADFRIASAIVIIIIGALIYIISILEIERYIRIFYFPLGILLGSSFAIAYAPCITPVMSKIMNFGNSSGNAIKGVVLLTVYAIGLSAAFIAVGSALSVSVAFVVREKDSRKLIVLISSLFLLILPVLLLSGYMIDYKTFLVGLLVE